MALSKEWEKAVWSQETYRLDEVENFKLPVVVRLVEGYYGENESEGFSQDDIIKIDEKKCLKKVAANFLSDVTEPGSRANDYVSLDQSNEILIPLGYKGAVKVVFHRKLYQNTKRLAQEMPKYVKTMKIIHVPSQTGAVTSVKRIIPLGTRLHVDRTLPGGPGEATRLVCDYIENGKEIKVGIPLDVPGMYETIPDEKEYTLLELIDSYSLPRDVEFVDDEIQRIYTSCVQEGIENMSNISGKLRLSRLKMQSVLVGHYKSLEEMHSSSQFVRRALVVIPMDDMEIREIEVKMLENDDDEDYERIMIKNFSQALNMDAVDGSLYVEFANGKMPVFPGLKPTSMGDRENKLEPECTGPPPPVPRRPGRGGAETTQAAPPVPDKPGQRRGPKPGQPERPKKPTQGKTSGKSTNVDQDDYELPELPAKPGPPAVAKKPTRPAPTQRGEASGKSTQDDDDDYETPDYKNVSLESKAQDFTFDIGSLDFSGQSALDQYSASYGYEEMKQPSTKSAVKEKLHNLLSRNTSKSRDVQPKSPKSPRGIAHPQQVSDGSQQPKETSENVYDYVDDAKLFQGLKKSSADAPHGYIDMTRPSPGPPRSTSRPAPGSPRNLPRPVAEVRPQMTVPESGSHEVKDIRTLTVEELEERLVACGLATLAKTCLAEKLDGRYFCDMNIEDFTGEPFNMTKFQLKKIQNARSNWVPKSTS